MDSAIAVKAVLFDVIMVVFILPSFYFAASLLILKLSFKRIKVLVQCGDSDSIEFSTNVFICFSCHSSSYHYLMQGFVLSSFHFIFTHIVYIFVYKESQYTSVSGSKVVGKSYVTIVYSIVSIHVENIFVQQ